MLTPLLVRKTSTIIRRKRISQVPGKVIVRKGQTVGTHDFVAEAYVQPKHIILDIHRGIGVASEETEKYIHVNDGESLSAGDLIAGPVGFTRRIVRATISGKFTLIGNGLALLQGSGSKLGIKAGFTGKIIELIPNRGVVIEAAGTIIQGVWGNGRIDEGNFVMKTTCKKPELVPDDIESIPQNSIVFGGYCRNPSVLKKAAASSLRGLVFGSIVPDLIGEVQKLPLSVLVLEGFGFIKVNSATYDLLSQIEGQLAAINSQPWDRMSGDRPEIIVPSTQTEEISMSKEVEWMIPGTKVRIVTTSHMGRVGTIEEIKGLAELPNGLRCPAAQVLFSDGEAKVIPVANLEVIDFE